MTRAQLDAAYDNTAAVRLCNAATLWIGAPQREGAMLERIARSRLRTKAAQSHRCVPVRQDERAAVHVHSRRLLAAQRQGVFACMADGPLSRGFDVALIGYTLAPTTLTGVIAEMHAAMLAARGGRAVESQPASWLSGWSAGGHDRQAVGEVDAGCDQRHLRCRAVPSQLPERKAQHRLRRSRSRSVRSSSCLGARHR